MKFLKYTLIALLVMMTVTAAVWMQTPATAATTNPPTGAPNYQLMAFPISAITGTTAAIAAFKVPWPIRIVSASVIANSVSGVVTIDVTNSAGTSMLTSAMTVSTVAASGTMATTSATRDITDETLVSINTSGAGTATNVTILLGVKRL